MAVAKCLTTGIPENCDRGGSGGVNKIRVAKRTDVLPDGNGLVRAADDHITAIVMEAGKVFYQLDFVNEQAVFLQSATNPNNNLSIAQSIELMITVPNDEIRIRLQELFTCFCGMIVTIQDNNGITWVMGGRDDNNYGQAKATLGEWTTGKALSDGYTVIVTLGTNASRWAVASDVEAPIV